MNRDDHSSRFWSCLLTAGPTRASSSCRDFDTVLLWAKLSWLRRGESSTLQKPNTQCGFAGMSALCKR